MLPSKNPSKKLVFTENPLQAPSKNPSKKALTVREPSKNPSKSRVRLHDPLGVHPSCRKTDRKVRDAEIQGFPKGGFCEGGKISIIGVVRAPVAIINFASNPCENL